MKRLRIDFKPALGVWVHGYGSVRYRNTQHSTPTSITLSTNDSTHPSADYPSVSSHTQSALRPKYPSSASLSYTTVPSLCLLPAALPVSPCLLPSSRGCRSVAALRRRRACCCIASRAPFRGLGGAWIGRAARRGGWSSGGGRVCCDRGG